MQNGLKQMGQELTQMGQMAKTGWKRVLVRGFEVRGLTFEVRVGKVPAGFRSCYRVFGYGPSHNLELQSTNFKLFQTHLVGHQTGL